MAAIRVEQLTKRGSPQLGKMPWISEQDYKECGIDLGIDPKTMDAAALADYRRQIEAEQEDEDWRRTHKDEDEDFWEEEGDCEEEEENWDVIMEEAEQ